MTVLLPKSAFLHIPKTGGTWVRNALKDAGLHKQTLLSQTPKESTENTPRSWHNVPLYSDDFLARKHVFCFVRHPLTWYQSYWAHKMHDDSWTNSKKHVNKLDECRANEFSVFMDNVIEEFPDGYVSWLFDFYTSHATFVGRIEQLRRDLVRALDETGETFSLDMMRDTPRAQVSSRAYKRKATYRKYQVAKIFTLDHAVIKKYGYDNTLPFLRIN